MLGWGLSCRSVPCSSKSLGKLGMNENVCMVVGLVGPSPSCSK